MKINPFSAIGIIALVLALCGIGWFAFHPKDMEPIKVYKAVLPQNATVETSPAPQKPETTQPEKEALTFEQRAEQQKAVTLEAVRILRGTETDPYLEKLQNAMETPEYQEYLKSQEGTFGVNLTAWWDFLESQGISSGRTLQERDYEAMFPEGSDAADYEPEMRKKLAELALEYPFKDTGGLLSEFWQDKRNYIWTRQHFNGHSGDYDWAENIRQNAGSILTEFTAVDIDPASPPATPLDNTPDPRITDAGEGNSVSPSVPRQDTAELTDGAQIPQSAEELEAAFTQDLFADVPNGGATNADFQKTLRERFSPQRFNTAMQTLTQYGPEEGLRRLKESDPEIATHVERLTRPEKETD